MGKIKHEIKISHNTKTSTWCSLQMFYSPKEQEGEPEHTAQLPIYYMYYWLINSIKFNQDFLMILILDILKCWIFNVYLPTSNLTSLLPTDYFVLGILFEQKFCVYYQSGVMGFHEIRELAMNIQYSNIPTTPVFF